MDDLPNIEPFRDRLREIEDLMARPEFYGNLREAAKLGRERQHLEDLLAAHGRYFGLLRTIEESEAILADETSDRDLRQLAQEELREAEHSRPQRRLDLLELMLPPDPSDSRNTVMEIRAGAGGDEAALFVGDLFRTYSRFAELQRWTVEPMSSHGSEFGGFKEIIFTISGTDVYRLLKFESGVHRVQRIPATEANGRIHTSTVTVAVLPEAEEVDVQISPEDLEVTVCHASGPGGQGVNTTDSAVQILHRPTGLIVSCADERSQQKNRAKALKVLRARLLKRREMEEQEKYAADRRNQIGSGDRSERIRTYNFPQNRLTDHRIGLTLYNLPEIMDGSLQSILDILQRENLKKRIEGL